MQRPSVPALCVVALLAAVAPVTLVAQGASPAGGGGGHADAAVAVRFGTLGLGIEVSKLFTSHLGVRVGGNYLKVSATKTESDITYDASLKLQAFSALIDFYPGSRGSFHLTGGIMTNPAKVSATGKPTTAGFDINGVTYTAAQVGTLTGQGKFPGAGPYFGIGWGTAARKGGPLGFLFDLGAFIGTAKISLAATGAVAGSQLATDLQAQVAETQKDVEKYAKVYPVLSLGLIYRF